MKLKWIVLISLFVGVFAGGAFLYIGFQHNIQGEFLSTGTKQIDFDYVAKLFSIWLIASFLLCFIVLLVARTIINGFNNILKRG
jgi:hypothetical protein